MRICLLRIESLALLSYSYLLLPTSTLIFEIRVALEDGQAIKGLYKHVA